MVYWVERIRLSMEYGAGLLIWGGLFNAACVFYLSTAFFYSAIVLSLMLKVGISAVSLYLNRQFENRDAVFFYINLGLSRRRMLATVLSVDYLVWTLLMVIILLTR